VGSAGAVNKVTNVATSLNTSLNMRESATDPCGR